MLIQINGAEIHSTEAINDHVNKTVNHSLHLWERQVTRVEIHLHDDNGSKGGVDKRCIMEVRLAGFQPLAVEEVDEDMYNAITKAGSKLERAVRHKIERHEAHKTK
ncbi:MAG: ribosome-associated translation inhibitor RaiA [Phycisphaeraceae bacterium]